LLLVERSRLLILCVIHAECTEIWHPQATNNRM
jgi:hypothetical protein